MADLRRGEYKQRVTFSNPTKTDDTAGGGTEAYTNFLTTWACVKDKSGNRDFDSALDQLITKKVIYVFYRASLAAALTIDTRITYNGKEYSIDKQDILNEEKKEFRFECTNTES